MSQRRNRYGRSAPRLIRFGTRRTKPLPRLCDTVLTTAAALAASLLFWGETQAQTGGRDSLPTDLLDGSRPAAAPATLPAAAALGPQAGLPAGDVPLRRNQPVTFTADEVEYDREAGVVTARGHVEAWQGERVLRADTFTYDRNTAVATARGNVQLIEADGQVLFAEEAELKDEYKEGVLTSVRALLARNGKLAANGVRRTDGTINELSRVVYSACDLCLDNPDTAPEWQVRARVAIQDKTLQRITYRDAVVDVHGVPVLYTPYLSHPDPSAPRSSGWLFPGTGVTRFLGAFAAIPYYWAIDPTSEATVTALFSTRQYPNLGGEFRKLFNNGELRGTASLGGLSGKDGTKEQVAGHINLRGRFNLDENWRWGFDLNRATNEIYMRTFRYEFRRILTSQLFLEGFWGTEGYARIEGRAYQGLLAADSNRQLPFVLPNATYEYAPRADFAGGNLTMDANVLGIVRGTGAHTQRLASRATWERPEIDDWGGLWNFRVEASAAGYNARHLDAAPSYLPSANGQHANGNIRAAVDWRMPFVRQLDEWGSQTIEPRVQLVTGPRQGRQGWLPNEDAIDFEFSDANLFQLNRFSGRDRQEGTTRADASLRGAWNFPNGGKVEGLVGRSYTLVDDHSVSTVYPNNGLERRGSDWVGRMRIAPVPWLETIGRVRLDGERPNERRTADATAFLHIGPITLSAGYLYAVREPYLLYIGARDEAAAGVTARVSSNWRIAAAAKYDLSIGRMAVVTGSAGYEDECLVLEGRVLRRFAQDLNTRQPYLGTTIVLVQLTLKTLGNYYFRAI